MKHYPTLKKSSPIIKLYFMINSFKPLLFCQHAINTNLTR